MLNFKVIILACSLILFNAGIIMGQTNEIVVKKSQVDKDLTEVNNNFRFRGKVINPKIVNAFVPWLSDAIPSTITIDIEGATLANQYYLNAEDTGTFASFAMPGDEQNKGSCSYQYLGKTESNIHVVRSTYNGGGSGNFNCILFFSFKVRKGFDTHGTRRDQLLMTLESMYLEGDRTISKVSISKNKVVIDKPVGMNKPVELNF